MSVADVEAALLLRDNSASRDDGSGGEKAFDLVPQPEGENAKEVTGARARGKSEEAHTRHTRVSHTIQELGGLPLAPLPFHPAMKKKG
jgi:hypothetical protein